MSDIPIDAKVAPLRPTRPCPICSKPSLRNSYPFCSAHCANVDLSGWLNERYVIAATPDDDSAEEDDFADI